MSRVLTASSATNASTNTGSSAWPTPAGPSRLGDGIQRSTATQHPGIPDPGRLRRAESPTGMRSPVASGPLRSYPRHDKHTNDHTHPVSATDPGMPIGRRRRRGRPGAGAQNLSQSDDTKRRIVGVSEHWPRRERGKNPTCSTARFSTSSSRSNKAGLEALEPIGQSSPNRVPANVASAVAIRVTFSSPKPIAHAN